MMEPAIRQAPKSTRTIPQKRRMEGDIQEAPPDKRITWPLLWIAAQEPTKAMIHPATPMSTREGESTKRVSRPDQAPRNRPSLRSRPPVTGEHDREAEGTGEEAASQIGQCIAD